MIGSIAFNPIVVLINDGRINITPNESGASKDSSYILVTGEGSPDDLRFIDGASKNGQIFWLQGTLTQIINLKAATISGIGSISGLFTVTVVTTNNHNLTTNDRVNILSTTNFNVNDVTVTVIDPTTFTYSAVGNITPESVGLVQNGNFVTVTGEDVVLDGTQSLNGVPMIPIIFDITAPGNGAWRPAQDLSGTGGASFPILYPPDDFGDQGAITLMVDISGTIGQNKKIRMIGDVGFQFTDPPTGDVLEEIWITFEQDGVGGHSITTTPTGLKNAAQLDVLLDKNPNAKTTFHFITEDDGVTFRGELVDLSVVSSISPLTTKGDIFTFDTVDARLPVGVDGQVLISNSLVALGVEWVDSFSSPLTTKGDLLGFDTVDARLPIGSDGQVLVADSLVALGVEWKSLSVLLSNVTIDVDKSWLGFNITDLGSIGSNAATVPGSGFIRMGATDQVRWKNILEDDDLYIDVQRPTLGVTTQDAFAFIVSGGVQMFIGEFDISVEQNDIINTGDVLPSGTGGEVGNSTNFYNQMHSQFFVPEGAAVIINRYGFAKTGDTLYVNFNDTDIDAAFAIYEEGFQRFRFSRFGTTPFVNEFFIGGNPFLAGEEYRIQMGENNISSARIFFIEGTGNDLILDRAGAGVDQGVQIRGAGLTIVRFLSQSIKIFQPLDANGEDLFNVVDIKSNGSGGATTGTIGELITSDGGFNYFIRNTLAWESNEDTKITFGSNGITVETNSSNTDISILAQGSSSDIDIRANGTGFLSLGLIGINHLQFASGVTQFSNANVTLSSGAQEIQFNDAIANVSVTTPVAADITLFNDLTTGELSVKKDDGSTVSLEGGGGVSNEIIEGDSFVRVTDTGTAVINFQVDSNPLGSITTALGWVLENDMTLTSGDFTLSTGDIILGNGFQIVNTSANTTTFTIPAGEFLSITESGSVRVLIEEDILFSCDSNNDILFQEIGVTVGRYDGGLNNWIFNEPVDFNGIVGDIVGTFSNFLGSLSVPWAGLNANRVSLILSGVTSGIFLVDADGIEINAVTTGDFIELKTQSTVRANFKAESDGGITFFEPLEVNDNIRIDGGNMIHAHDGTECGFAVTDDITSPGSLGTIQGPVNTGSISNATDSNNQFGDAVGCKGLYLNFGGIPTYVVKIIAGTPGTWQGMIFNNPPTTFTYT